MELQNILDNTISDDKSVQSYNNLDYYLEQNNQYKESVYLLHNILEKYPLRVLSWINYGDSLWGLNEKSQAKSAYQKYISLMKSQKKNLTKIPQRVFERSK